MKPSALKAAALRAGISLIETLMVVAVMSTLAAGAVLGIKNVVNASENTKLQRDVNVVNSAIRIYLLNGGTFLQSDLQSPATVLAKLKKRTTAQKAKQLAGLRGGMTDERLTFEMQSSEEASEGAERARFIADPANPRFVIQTSGPPGIRRFVLETNLARVDHGTEDRSTTMELATRDPWVWDYTERAPAHDYPSLPPPRDPTVVNPNPPDAGNLVLNPPGFSIPSSTVPLLMYPRTLALLPTNPAGTAQILYSINGNPFLYYGSPMTVDPGMTVTGISMSLDPDRYEDSPPASETYQTTPVTPATFMFFSRSGYNYFELGGEADPGTPPPLPAGSVTGTGFITNLVTVPVAYQNSSVFRYVWTTNGTNPLTSASAIRQADFSGGFTPVAIPLPLVSFGTAASVMVRSAVKAQNPAIVRDSIVRSQTLSAVSLRLRSPLLSIDGRDVTLTLDVSRRDMPRNARIYFTVDGTDPGVNAAGDPLRGTLYTGAPFTLNGVMGANVTVRARVYTPTAYRQFFTSSQLTSTSLVLPAVTSIFVGGSFVNPAGSLMRNIARLNNSGQIDTRFDTGSGASNGSLVGVVRQTGSGVMAGGDFDTLNGTPRPGVVRLNPNGSVDTGFDAGLSSN